MTSLILTACLASAASAETILARWNANGTGAATYLGATSGSNASTGTVGGQGQSAPSTPLSTILTNGAASDPGTVITGTTYNRSFVVNPPLTSAANKTVGIWFKASTEGMAPGEAVKVSWSQSIGYRSSRYWQVLVSTSGSSGLAALPAVGTGTSISQFINGMTSGSAALSGTASVVVNGSGLVDFRTLNNLSLNPAQITTTVTPANYASGFVDGISLTLPTGLGFENNANFTFAIVGAFDPSYGGTSGTNGYVSSYAGTDSTDLTNGYNRSLASGGSMRLDLVTISSVAAVPEPSAAVLAGLGVAMGCWAFARRRRRPAHGQGQTAQSLAHGHQGHDRVVGFSFLGRCHDLDLHGVAEPAHDLVAG